MRSSQRELLCSIEPIRALAHLTNSDVTSRAPLSASATMTSRNCWAIRFHSLKTLPAATTDQSLITHSSGVVFEVRSLKHAGRRVYSLYDVLKITPQDRKKLKTQGISQENSPKNSKTARSGGFLLTKRVQIKLYPACRPLVSQLLRCFQRG